METKVVAIALGGALGALLRFAVHQWCLERYGLLFPYGTLLVNLTGAFAMGLVMTIFLRDVQSAPAWRLFSVTGVLGGYTTFSALAWETFALAEKGNFRSAFVYSGSTFAGGLIALVLGVWLGRSIFA